MVIDKLYKRVEEKGCVCVGLDTDTDYIPTQIKNKYQDIDEVVFQFNKRIIDATYDIVSTYKLQIAYYEALGVKGLMAYSKTLKYLKSNDLISIGDIKRGDISTTATMYKKAHFEGEFEADFVTLNPYMGFDSITPYLDNVANGDKGIFVLLRTSNPGAKDIEYLKCEDGREVYFHVGDKLYELSNKYLSSCGYSPIGAVVGGTHTDEAMEIRNRYDKMFFLIPGYGAQGAKGNDVNLYLKNRNGGIVNSSRGIIMAHKGKEDEYENFNQHIRKTVFDMREDIGFERGKY